MKDTWYGDKRDVVKWGTLVHLARHEGIGQIVQVAFLREGDMPSLNTPQGEVPIAEEVRAHFRDVRSISKLGRSTGLNVEVITRPFDLEPRRYYMSWVTDRLRDMSESKVVLLDPDTGIEPQRATREHVKVTEVRDLWETLLTGDWLVLYQHRRMFDNRWRETTKQRFQQACSTEKVEVFSSERIANDVIFLAAKKH